MKNDSKPAPNIPKRLTRKIRSTKSIEKTSRSTKIQDLIPSEDFFVDLEDLSMKLRLGGHTSDRIKQQEYISKIKKKIEKKQKKNENILKSLNFSEDFSPSIMCNGKSRYFGAGFESFFI